MKPRRTPYQFIKNFYWNEYGTRGRVTWLITWPYWRVRCWIGWNRPWQRRCAMRARHKIARM